MTQQPPQAQELPGLDAAGMGGDVRSKTPQDGPVSLSRSRPAFGLLASDEAGYMSGRIAVTGGRPIL